jgi:hypothetical protein
LPRLWKKVANEIHTGLKSARGVAISFDLWMSRKTKNNLSFDIHYNTEDWRWQHNHVGILSCSVSSVGIDIAAKLQPTIEEFGLSKKIFSIVKDGGGNLSTVSKSLTDKNMVRCSALGMQSPYETIYFAHKVNNACSVTVKVAKESTKEADMQKIVIRYPLRESGPGGCVGKGSGPEDLGTLEVLDLKWEF